MKANSRKRLENEWTKTVTVAYLNRKIKCTYLIYLVNVVVPNLKFLWKSLRDSCEFFNLYYIFSLLEDIKCHNSHLDKKKNFYSSTPVKNESNQDFFETSKVTLYLKFKLVRCYLDCIWIVRITEISFIHNDFFYFSS